MCLSCNGLFLVLDFFFQCLYISIVESVQFHLRQHADCLRQHLLARLASWIFYLLRRLGLLHTFLLSSYCIYAAICFDSSVMLKVEATNILSLASVIMSALPV